MENTCEVCKYCKLDRVLDGNEWRTCVNPQSPHYDMYVAYGRLSCPYWVSDSEVINELG